MRNLFSTILLFACTLSFAQQPNNPSLHQLLQLAETNYPLLKAKQFSIDAAKKAVEVSKSSKNPSLDAAYQLNYATYNNLTGMAYPQYLIPISGPPSASNNSNGVFGSAANFLFNWQAVTFGQKDAQIAQTQAGVKYASADAANEILNHKIKVANAYLDVLTYNELDKLYQENITRTETNLATVKTLVANGIKPGVDTALFSSEVSKAKIDGLNIKKNREQALVSFTQLLATDNVISISDSSFFTKLPSNNPVSDTTKNPLLSLFNTSLELNQAKRKSIAKTTMPILGVWATTYARGSGVNYDGSVKAIDGIGMQRINYGVGFQLSVPILKTLKIKPQLQQQDLLIRADQEKLNEITLQLNKQLQSADTTLQYAFAIAKESPLLVQSANYAYTVILSRYNAGLANYSDVMQIQYNLLKAQTDYKTAYMSVWKTMLYKAAIKGDINLFLNQVN